MSVLFVQGLGSTRRLEPALRTSLPHGLEEFIAPGAKTEVCNNSSNFGLGFRLEALGFRV